MAASELVTLDPAEFIDGRTELPLDKLGLAVREAGADWGESQLAIQIARQQIGEAVTDRHLGNVEMTIPILVKEQGEVSLAEAAYKLQQKVGLLQQEGGWIRRDFAELGGFAGSVGYQVKAASLSGLQGWLMAHRRNAPDVVLKLVRGPLCYATVEAESKVFEEAKERELIWELAEMLGTAPGLIRLRVTNNNSSGDWRGLICAIECRDHPQDETANTTAKLAYAATELTPKGGAKEAEREGFKVVRHSELTAGWLTILDSEIAGVGHMTHKGVRRLWLRIWDPGEAPGGVQLHPRWRPLGSINWSEENPIVPTPLVDDWALVDLGECRPEAPVVGDGRWEWQLRARSPGGKGAIDIARVWPLPIEQYAVLTAPPLTTEPTAQSIKSPGEGASTGGGGGEWLNPNNVKTSNNARATAELKTVKGGVTQNLTQGLAVTKFGFVIPEGATVTGVVAEIERSAEGEGRIEDRRINLLNGEGIALSRSRTGAWPTSDDTAVYGSATDLWGLGLNVAAVNSTAFGIEVQCTGFLPAIARIDYVRLIVYYSEATDENRICFAERSIELRSDGMYRQHPTDDVWGPLIPIGFLPFAPPSGMENRKVRGILIPTQGDLGELPDSGTNKESAQVISRDAYHFAREAA